MARILVIDDDEAVRESIGRMLGGAGYVVQAATLAAVLVAVLSQIISDVGYTFLNPRIRYT